MPGKITRWTRAFLVLGLLLTAPPSRAQTPRRHAIVIGNNLSLDEGVTRLSYADDDAIRFFELFQAAGADVTLLTVADPDAQRRFPQATRVAIPPTREEVLRAVTQVFARIQAEREAGLETHFFFIYSGHGGLGAGREGYINLLDARLRRSELFHEVIARSPATFNHLVLDACHAYYFVQKRGEAPDKEGDYGGAARSFLDAEELSAYPNTGAILAASPEAETHEWGRWEAGIFSHELRSALLGGADVDADGAVSYAEAAAFIEAANGAIEVPRARLRVWHWSPASRIDVPLLTSDAFGNTPRLIIEPADARHYHLEDVRGVRIADCHPSQEQPVRLALVGSPTFFLKTEDQEAPIPQGAQTSTRDLVFTPANSLSKGGIEASFRRHLFQTPFGLGFYQGLLAAQASRATAGLRIETPAPALGLRTLGWGGVVLGTAVGLAGGVTIGLAERAHDQYERAANQADALALRRRTEQWAWTSYALWGAGGAVLATGVTLLIVDHRRAPRGVAPLAMTDGRSTFLGLTGVW